jgi:hypothetical protein
MLELKRLSDVSWDRFVYIFGAGEPGRLLRHALESERGIRTLAFIDSYRRGTVDGLPIINVNEFLRRDRKDGHVLLCSPSFHDMADLLAQDGFEHVINAWPFIQAERERQPEVAIATACEELRRQGIEPWRIADLLVERAARLIARENPEHGEAAVRRFRDLLDRSTAR